ncbi:MAG: hypothetical protein FK733_10400 [Asgard group archaeon]|nr:hypothetical protein [Asgard group archaeon]
MGNFNSKIKFVNYVLLLLILYSNLFSAVQGRTFEVKSFSSVAPIIDGYVNDIEWKNAGKPKTITLQNPWDLDHQFLDIEIRSIHCNASYLYIGVTIELDNIISHGITLYLHSNKLDNFKDENGNVNDGNDVKIITSATNSTLDGYLSEEDINDDTKYGGVNNTIGKCFQAPSFTSYEFEIPFESGDTNGRDITTFIDDSFEFSISIQVYFQKGPSKVRGIYVLRTNSRYYLVISSSSAMPLPSVLILIGLFTVFLFQYRKNRKLRK